MDLDLDAVAEHEQQCKVSEIDKAEKAFTKQNETGGGSPRMTRTTPLAVGRD